MPNSIHLEGVVAFNSGNYQKAKALFLSAINEGPEEADSHLFLGNSYFLCGEISSAIQYLNKYIELNQGKKEKAANVSYAYDSLGQCYGAQDKYIAAIRCYTKATAMNPLAASAWHNFGLFYIKSAQHYLEQDLLNSFTLFQEAKNFLNTALRICSTDPAFLHSVAGWYEQSIEALKKVIEDQDAVQKNIDNNFKLAIQYYQEALSACSKAKVLTASSKDLNSQKGIIKLNFTEFLAQYGHYLYRSGNFTGALDLYFRAIKLDPMHLQVINQIGMSFFKKNCFLDARKYFSDILNITSDPQELADAWLNIACTHRMEKSWIIAEDALNKAKKFAPENSSIFDEEQKLRESKAPASLIAAPQTIFSNHNPVPQLQSIASEEKRFKIDPFVTPM